MKELLRPITDFVAIYFSQTTQTFFFEPDVSKTASEDYYYLFSTYNGNQAIAFYNFFCKEHRKHKTPKAIINLSYVKIIVEKFIALTPNLQKAV